MAGRWNPFVVFLTCLLLCLAPAGCKRDGGEKQPQTAPSNAQNGSKAPHNEGDAAQSGDKSDPVDGDSARKGEKSDPKHPVVLIETTLGNITIRLDRENAQLTVDNFLDYVDAGHYDQTIIHQVYKGQGFVAGGYDSNLVEKPVRTPIRNEADNGLKNRRGAVSMVRFPDAIDSATSQFFINVSDNPALDHKDRTPEGYGFCVFGEVVEGMDVVMKIDAAPVRDTADFERTPAEQIVIKTIKRIR